MLCSEVLRMTVQADNRQDAALNSLLDPEQNTALQLAAADAASRVKTKAAAERQVRRRPCCSHLHAASGISPSAISQHSWPLSKTVGQTMSLPTHRSVSCRMCSCAAWGMPSGTYARP